MKQKAKRKEQKPKATEQAKKPLGPFVPAVALGLVAALAVVAGISSHGWTYDELIYAKYGLESAQWLIALPPALFGGKLGQYLSATAISDAWYSPIDMQPPFAQVLSGLSSSLLSTSVGDVIATRLPVALLFGVAIASLFWLTDAVAGRRAAWFSAVALTLLPRFFGDAHLISLDMPVSALVVLTAAVFFAAAARDSWRLASVSGLLMGAAVLTKLNAVFLIGCLIVWCGVFHRRMLPKAAVAFLVVSPIVFFLGWPWLWHDTLANLSAYLGFHLRHYPVLTYYLGRSHDYAPWHYPFVMTAVTVPAVVLLFSLLGVGVVAGRRLRHPSSGGWLFLICLLGYLLPSAMPFSPKYNGVRLFDPAFPFMMGLAGFSFSALAAWLGRRLERVRALAEIPQLQGKVAGLLGIALLLPSLIGLVSVRPHELAYYNWFVGGPAGARERGFETIYWGGVYLHALPALNAIERSSPRILVTPQGVVSVLKAYQVRRELREDIEWTTPPPPEEQVPDWPGQRLRGVDLVVFQCAQAEFDALSWKLYREGKPEPISIYHEGVPLLLVFRGDEARRLFPLGSEDGNSAPKRSAGSPTTASADSAPAFPSSVLPEGATQ